jgi:uncharacterized membrane protein YcfT
VKERYNWVDYSKGICILGVVIMYAEIKLKGSLGSVGWVESIAIFMKPFRMPDFFLLSGLFLGRVIDRPWREYLDKRALHYLYFFVLWSVIFFLFRVTAIKLGLFPADNEPDTLIFRLIHPFAMLWFIQLLPILFIATRLLKSAPAWAVLILGVTIQAFPAESYWGQVENFCDRFIYFYIGYRFASYLFQLAGWTVKHQIVAAGALVVWAGINATAISTGISKLPLVSVFLGLAGSSAVIVLGCLLMQLPFTNWIRYLGENSIVIYLGFYLPMMFIAVAARKLTPFIDAGSIGAITTALSILAALIMFWATRKTVFSFLFKRPGWISLTNSSKATRHSTPSLKEAA